MTNELLQLGDDLITAFGETDELLRQALIAGDTLTTPKESQMLINITGVSISAKSRKDGRYQGYILQDGGKKYFYGKTRDEVATKMKLFLQEERTKPKQQKKEKASPIFGEYVERWIELYKKPNLKPSSIATLYRSMKPAQERFGKMRLNAIKADDVQELLLGITAERTRDLCRINLNQMFKKALAQGIIKRNPCDAVEIKRHKAKRKRALSVKEQQDFVRTAAETKYSLLFRFLLATGLRIGEALALLQSDVDFERCTVSVTKNIVHVEGKAILQDTPKSEAGNRTVPIPKEMCEEIRQIETKYLFPYHYNAVKCSIDRISRSTGVKVTLHTLRHTYATRLEEGGIPPKIKQYLMGHASLEMTENVYTDTQPEYVDRMSNRVRELF